MAIEAAPAMISIVMKSMFENSGTVGDGDDWGVLE
jgi:hypothetical protein